MKDFTTYLSEGVNDKNVLKAFILAGGAGVGKSYVTSKVTAGTGLKIVALDDVLVHLWTKAGLSLKMPKDEEERRTDISWDAIEKNDKRLAMYLQGRLGIVLDGTAQDRKKVEGQKKMLTELGYDVHMIFVHAPLEVALARNEARPRSIPEDVVKSLWKNVQKNKSVYKRMFGDNMLIIDNTDINDDELNKVWKQINKMLAKPVKNPVGKQWLKDNK